MDIIQPPSSDIIPASVLTTQGDIIVRGVAAPQRLGIGTKRKILRINDVENNVNYENLDTIIRRAIMIRDSSVQTIPNTIETTLDFNNAYSDINNICDLPNNKIVPNIPGFYLCLLNIHIDNPVPVGYYTIYLMKNVDVIDRGYRHITGVTSVGLKLRAMNLAYVNGITDYFKASMYQSSGGTVNILPDLEYFCMSVLGPF